MALGDLGDFAYVLPFTGRCLFAMLNNNYFSVTFCLVNFFFPTQHISGKYVYSHYGSTAASNDMSLHSQCLSTCHNRYSSVAVRGLLIGVMALLLRKGSPEVFSGECAVDSRMASIAPGI